MKVHSKSNRIRDTWERFNKREVFHPGKLFYALVGAAIFIIMGRVLVDTYFRYFDTTQYFTVKQPVEVDKHIYAPCDTVTTTIVRNSQVQSNAHATVELILIDVNNEWVKKTLKSSDINIDVSQNQIIHMQFPLPCNLSNGAYFLKAVVTYKLRDIPKTYSWITNSFEVNKLDTL